MMRLWKCALVGAVVAILSFLVAHAEAFTCTATGCSATASYVNATKNTAGGPVTLTKSRLYVKIGAAPETFVDTPAGNTAGGDTVTVPVQVAVVPGAAPVTISVSATNWNATGESARSAMATLTIDRSGEVVPATPGGVTIQ